MTAWLEWALGAHLALCVALLALRRARVLRIHGGLVLVACMVPVFGALGLLAAKIAVGGASEDTAEELCDGLQEPGSGSLGMDVNGDPDLLPLEEALLINDAQTRRAILLDMLLHDPKKYTELLKLTRLNSDPEVVHYATATIMEIQRDYELSLQQLERAMARRGGNLTVLDETLGAYDGYLESGLLEGYPQRLVRLRYHSVLVNRLIQPASGWGARVRMARNALALGDAAAALREAEQMARRWPEAEEVWLLGLQAAAESRDGALLRAWLDRMVKAPVHWSAQGREILRFWLGKPQSGAAGQAVGR